ncbi:MAG: pseudouridine synthase [Methanospirillaceae archaeon]|nr:pseudouridine synthase [Methanospirillaceae archaeon]
MKSTKPSDDNLLKRARVIADFQFGERISENLFPDGCSFILSRRRELRQILYKGKRLATLRAHDGRLTLGLAGAIRLHSLIPPPLYRIVIRDDVSEFISAGKNVFAKHVISADPGIMAGDEVLVVDSHDTLLATGEALLGGKEVCSFSFGQAVEVRHGISSEET